MYIFVVSNFFVRAHVPLFAVISKDPKQGGAKSAAFFILHNEPRHVGERKQNKMILGGVMSREGWL